MSIKNRFCTPAILSTSIATLFVLSGAAMAQTVGVFSNSGALGGQVTDQTANVGLSTSKTYIEAIDLGDAAGTTTVNGVTFTRPGATANPSGTGWSITGNASTGVYGGGGSVPLGAVGGLTNAFVYGGNPEVLTLTGLTVDETYSITFYNRSWDAAGQRVANFTASGASTGVAPYTYDEDIGAAGQGNLNLIRYTFQAGTTTQAITIAPTNPANTFHTYAFSNEQVFNKTWASGTDWTTSTWSAAGAPNSVGANASFTSQGAPTALNLNASQTVGHVQFDGGNAWTLSTNNASTLTLQTDVGGVSVLSAKTGRHEISAPVTFANDVMKGGGGTVVLSGAITDAGKNITLGAGTLEIANSAAQSLTGVITGAGALAKSGAGTLTLTRSAYYTGNTIISGGILKLAQGATGTAVTPSIANLNGYTFSPAINNLLAGLSPTVTNAYSPAGVEGTGAVTMLTNGAIVTNNANTYTIGNNAVLTYSLGASPTGYDLTAVNLFSGWNDAGRANITLTNISYSTVAAPTTFTPITGTGDNYGGGGAANGALITASGGVLATGVSSVRFNFGNQQNNYVGYRELEVVGTVTGGVLPIGTAVQITSGASLDLNGVTQMIGSLADSAGSGGAVINSAGSTPLTLTLNPTSGSTTFSGTINDAGSANAISLVKMGSGTQVLAGSNSYSGVTTVNNGTLSLTGSLTGGGAISTAGAGVLNESSTGVISGASSVTLAGTGAHVLGGTNSYSGITTFAGGTVNVASLSDYGSNSSLGNRAADSGGGNVGLLFRGGTLQYTGSTAQSTNRSIRISTVGGATIDASGSVPSATLTFTATSSPDFFENGGNRTLTLTGSNTGDNTFAMGITQAGGATSVVKSGAGKWVLTGTESYTGTTIISGGTLRLTNGFGGTTLGGITVAGSGTTQLNIEGGTYTQGAGGFFVGNTTGAGTVNQTGGDVSWNNGGLELLIGNGGTGTYNLSAGTLTTNAASGNRGVMLGVNSNASVGPTATFNLSGSGVLNTTSALLMVGRSDATGNINTTNLFTQTGGTATVGILTIGGNAGDGANNIVQSSTLSLTGGTFSATSFTLNAASGGTTSAITIGGTAQVTLPIFPTARGTFGSGSTATITFDSTTGGGGFLAPTAGSAAYMPAGSFTHAYLTANGANFNVGSGKDITVAQVLENAPSATGTLTKTGAGVLTLSGANTYTGLTSVTNGSLTLGGAGSISNSSGITVNGSAAKFVQTSSVAVTSGITLTQGTVDGTGTVGAVSVDAAGSAASKVVANGNLTSTTALTLGSLLYNGSGTASLRIPGGATLNSPGLAVTGALTLSGGAGSVAVNIAPSAPLVNGNTYQLISYGGVFSGTASSAFTLAPGVLSGRQFGTFASTAASNGFITLAVAGDNPAWSGANGSTLVQYPQLSGLTTGNLALKTNPAPTDFWTSDFLEFNDTYNAGAGVQAVTNSIVNINGGATNANGIAAIVVTFNNSAVDYTITSNDGTGITAGSVIKNGTGMATIGTSHSYTGATTINNGVLNLTGSLTGGTAILTTGAGVLDESSIAAISGAASSVTLTGTGTSVLGGTNSYTGTTSIGTGTTLSLTGSLADTAISTAGTGVLSQSSTGVIGGAASVTLAGTGTSVLGGTNSYTGTTSIGDGTTLSLTGSLGATSISTAGTGVLSQSSTGSISGAASLTLAGTGTSVLGGTNNYTGATSIGNGTTLSLTTGSVSGTAISTAGTGVLNESSTGSISGAASLTLSGTGTSVLGGANSYNGATSIGNGTTLSLTGSVNGTVISTAGTGILNESSTGVISGAVGVNLVGTGTSTLGGINDYSGVTVIQNGIVNVASVTDYAIPGSLGSRSSGAEGPQNIGILFRGGTLQYTGSTPQSTNRAIRISTVGGAIIDASGSIPSATLSFTGLSSPDFFENPGTRTLTLTGSNTGDNTFGMAIIDQGANRTALVKNGVGTWILTGNITTYSGQTYINAGALRITNNTSLGAGGFDGNTMSHVANGAALELQGGIFVNEHFHFLGVGPAGLGSIRSVSGNNALTTNLGIDGNSAIGVDADSLTISSGLYVDLNSTTIPNPGITKVGAGTLVLSGSNSYTGATIVSAGTLVAGAASSVSTNGPFGNASSAILLGDAATTTNNSSPSLLIGGAFTVARDVTVANQATSGTYSIGGSTADSSIFSGAVAFSQNLTVTAALGGTVNLTGSVTGTAGKTLTKTGNGTLYLAGTQTYDALTTNGGITNVNTAIGTGTSTVNANATTNFGVSQSLAALSIGPAATAKLTQHTPLGAGPAMKAMDTAALTVNATGKLDLVNNALIARGATIGTPTAGVYNPVGSPATGRYNGIEGLVQTGFYNGGGNYWEGPGINSSDAAFDTNVNSNFLYSIGAVDNNQPGFGGILYGTGGLIGPDFAGVSTLTGAEILAKFTYFGDSDLNGQVDGTDYSLIDNGFNSTLTGWLNGDFDHNGVVDGTDYSLIDNAFNSQSGPLLASSSGGGGSAVVPEPGSIGLLLVGALGFAARRRRQSA